MQTITSQKKPPATTITGACGSLYYNNVRELKNENMRIAA
jgi:hypothetical protein